MTTSISVRPTHNPLQFMMRTVKPQVVVDGKQTQLAWGSATAVTVDPGPHTVEVFYPYFGRKSGAASIKVTAIEGQTASLHYSAPFFVTSAGRLSRD